jgi:hypothetical protein
MLVPENPSGRGPIHAMAVGVGGSDGGNFELRCLRRTDAATRQEERQEEGFLQEHGINHLREPSS